MLIVCPTCATSYDVEPASLGANGRQVRCVRCRTVWLAELNRAAQLTAEIGLPPGSLDSTLEYYNEHAAVGEDPLYHKRAPARTSVV